MNRINSGSHGEINDLLEKIILCKESSSTFQNTFLQQLLPSASISLPVHVLFANDYYILIFLPLSVRSHCIPSYSLCIPLHMFLQPFCHPRHLFSAIIYHSLEPFLVACTRVYKSLCRYTMDSLVYQETWKPKYSGNFI